MNYISLEQWNARKCTATKGANLVAVERKCFVPGSVGVAAAGCDGGRWQRMTVCFRWLQRWRPVLEVKEEICRNWAKMLVFWLTLDPIFSSSRSSTEILFIGGVRGTYCLYWGKVSALDSTRGIQTVGSKCAPRAAKFGSSRPWTARGGHLEPLNGAVSKFFDPTGPFSGIKGFQVDMLVHVLSDLKARRAGNCAWKAATRAAFRGRKWTVTGDVSPGFPAPFSNQSSSFQFLQFGPGSNPIQPLWFTRLFQIGPWFRIFSIKSLIAH